MRAHCTLIVSPSFLSSSSLEQSKKKPKKGQSLSGIIDASTNKLLLASMT